MIRLCIVDRSGLGTTLGKHRTTEQRSSIAKSARNGTGVTGMSIVRGRRASVAGRWTQPTITCTQTAAATVVVEQGALRRERPRVRIIPHKRIQTLFCIRSRSKLRGCFISSEIRRGRAHPQTFKKGRNQSANGKSFWVAPSQDAFTGALCTGGKFFDLAVCGRRNRLGLSCHRACNAQPLFLARAIQHQHRK